MPGPVCQGKGNTEPAAPAQGTASIWGREGVFRLFQAESLELTMLLSPQRSRVGIHPHSHTQSCRDALAWRWGTNCCTYAPQVTSQAAERQPSPCCATAVGSGMAWHRPAGKVSVPSRASLVHLGSLSLESSQMSGCVLCPTSQATHLPWGTILDAGESN